MKTKTAEKLKEMLCTEIEKYSMENKISASALEALYKLTDVLKNIEKIEMLESDEYSEAGDWNANGNFYANGRNGSYRQGGMSRRNSMRYDDDMSMRRGGMRTSRGDAKSYMMEQMEMLMNEATDERDRMAIQNCMEVMRNA